MEGGSGSARDRAHISRDWELTADRIAGSGVREVRNIVTANGITTELYRRDWEFVEGTVEAAIHVALRPAALSAWHLHRERWDYLFVVDGHVRLVLFDPRADSPTRGKVDVHHLGGARPMLVSIPPGVWHGVQNLGAGEASFVNLFDAAYDYENPDEWRLPPDTDEIPYRFPA